MKPEGPRTQRMKKRISHENYDHRYCTGHWPGCIYHFKISQSQKYTSGKWGPYWSLHKKARLYSQSNRSGAPCQKLPHRRPSDSLQEQLFLGKFCQLHYIFSLGTGLCLHHTYLSSGKKSSCSLASFWSTTTSAVSLPLPEPWIRSAILFLRIMWLPKIIRAVIWQAPIWPAKIISGLALLQAAGMPIRLSRELPVFWTH